ncbi:MAG: glucose-6-phosphate dehydrogenase [Verrucomicrobiales bacterium]|nr:glucose-6-phosphate dehydrogenase [Verrucomicrobiales bacterium]
MNDASTLDELLVCRLDTGKKVLEPCTVVIFGASGDLTARKLVPALYHLFLGRRMPMPFRIVGFARRSKTDAEWRAELREALGRYSRTKPVDEVAWAEFSANLHYCAGEFHDLAAYVRLKKLLKGFGEPALAHNLLCYLAISPSQFGEVVERLHASTLVDKSEGRTGWQRIVIEKPFGSDLATARALNADLTRHAHESQLFRIDHYLGKETVQNLLMFRFSNAIFERLWNREAIDHVQITVSERHGVGSRGGYYEEAGALRDMVQNHLLQVLSLMAMEPPVSLEAEAIRDEKVKLLKALRIWQPEQVPHQVIRGQYAAGTIGGEAYRPYREEAKVAPASNVETFVALRVLVDNWRWSGVPFYLRTGKSLALSASEVRVQFRPTPHVLFAAQCGPRLDANSLTLRLQPNEGITLRFNGKVPGTSMQLRPVRMHFSYDAEFGAYTPEAYERLLLEAMAGDATLFIRRDEVETAWQFVDAIREGWRDQPLEAGAFYEAGGWGPKGADELLARYGHAWRNPQPVA